MTSGPFSPSAPPTADPSATASLPGSSSPTDDEIPGPSDRLGGALSGRADLETWTPEDPATAQQVLADVQHYCQTYCPAVLACGEEACRLWRLEERAAAIISPPGPAENGVVTTPVIGVV